MSRGTPVHDGLVPSIHGDAYLFEEYYLEAVPDFPEELAYRGTARCVARWSDWYSITRYWGPEKSEEGALPVSPDEREAFVDAIFDRPQHADSPPLALSFRDGERWTFDAHDGFPGPIYLLPSQLDELRAAWATVGLPSDLYYPVMERRLIVEPHTLDWHGTVVRRPRFYSPRQWQHRDHAAIVAIHVPTDEERRTQLREASNAYLKALNQRLQELAEPPYSVLQQDRSLPCHPDAGGISYYPTRMHEIPPASG